MTNLIGGRPRPRVLVIGQPGGPAFPEALGKLVPTSQVVTDVQDIRLDEWDVVVTDQPLWNIPKRIFVLATVPAPKAAIETIVPVGSMCELDIRCDSGHICNEFEPPNVGFLGDDLCQLVTRFLLPIVINRRAHQYFFAVIGRFVDPTEAQNAQASVLEPILQAGSGVILAGMYRRGRGGAEAWLLPADIGELLPWVEAAFKRWQSQDAQCFPLISGGAIQTLGLPRQKSP